ncbi:myelin-oligodendrocyte glycoprotein-like [Macrotis lagotis]|uniref:myelin-oligodendrocyte glycoprotein-like n=1 Tax=Macrotis lagotis TaxID=92651 RepID=UPI003D691071
MESLNLSGSFLSHFVIAFILLLKKSTLASGQFSVIGPAGPLQTSFGDEVELPCYLSPPQSAQHMEVVWLQSSRVVHLYQDGEDRFGDQDPNYQGRTELVRDGMANGNITLKIHNVRLLDAGSYKCLIENGFYQGEADLELKVLGKETVSQMLPPLYFFFLIVLWFVLYVIFLLYMLLYKVYFRRSYPWMGEISGIFVLTTTLEIEMGLFYLWMRHRCRGIVFDETSSSKEWKLVTAILFLAFTTVIPIFLHMKYFFQQSSQLVHGPHNEVQQTIPDELLSCLSCLWARRYRNCLCFH